MKLMRLMVLAAVASVGVMALGGCGGGGGDLVAYTGGGLPPGEPDLGGIVVASTDGTTDTAQATGEGELPPGTEPLAGARVSLQRGRAIVGRTRSGEGGYFRFDHPLTGNYTLIVEPPEDRPDLERTERAVHHVQGQRTFVTVELPETANQPGPPGLSR